MKKITYKEKIVAPNNIPHLIECLRAEKKRVATINGSFDLLHAGHLYILSKAAEMADVLIVALNSDASIKLYKSPTRPIIPLTYRLEMMAALGFVDFVTWFDETDPINLLKIIKPDVHVNGGEYGSNCIEAQAVAEGGGILHLVDRIDGLSTTEILEKIKCVS